MINNADVLYDLNNNFKIHINILDYSVHETVLFTQYTNKDNYSNMCVPPNNYELSGHGYCIQLYIL